MPLNPIPVGTQILRCSLVAVLYFLLGRFGMSMPYKLSVISLLWLPIGLTVPAVFRWGWTVLLAVFAGPVAISLSNGQSWSVALSLAGATVLGTAVIVALLRRLGFNPMFRRREDVVKWCVAGSLGTTIIPTLGSTILGLSRELPWSAWGQAWLMWWPGDLIGLFLAGPALMSVSRAQLLAWRNRLGEVTALAGLTALLSWATFFEPWTSTFALFNPMMILVPLQVWAALRFGVLGASSLALGVAIIAALATSRGIGAFAGLNPGVAVFSLWAFAGMAAMLSLLITALEAERTEGEATLRKQERELRALTDNLPDVIMRLDRARRVVFANRALELETGFPAGHFFGRTVFETGFPSGTVPNWGECLERVLGASRAETLEFELNGPNGPRHWTAQMVPELDEHAAVQSVLIICHETTEHHRLEVQLRQSQKLEAVGTLAGGIAHDFNNILTGIFGNTQMAMMDLPKESPVQEWMRNVLQASQRAKTLVNKVMAFSRRQDPRKVPVRLQSIVEEAMQLLRPSIPSSIAINTRLPPGTPQILADPGQLHQVLLNLVTNSAHAIGDAKRGAISICLDAVDVDEEAVRQRPQLRCGRFVRLAVSDTGRGMDSATLARIFEPFFTTKERGSGTGLGLSVVHGIIEQHAGCMVVDSEPGKGTTFMIYLPAYGEAPGALDAAEPRPEARRGAGEHIMLVDDEQIVLRAAAGILQRLGYTTSTYADPEEALRAFKSDPSHVDLVLTDLTMPKMRGSELAARMRDVRPGIPILLCTGYGGAPADGESASKDSLDLLLKPFTVEILARRVADALHKPGSPGAA